MLRAQPLFKSCYLLIYLGNSAHSMIPEISLPCSQQPASGLCPEPNESIMCLPVPFKIRFNNVFPSLRKLFRESSIYTSLPCLQQVPPSHSVFDILNRIRWRVQMMVLLVMQLSPACFYLLPHSSKSWSHHPLFFKLSLCLYSSMQSFFILIFTFSDFDVNGIKHSANLICF